MRLFFHTHKYIAPLNQTSTTTLTNDSNSHADWSKEKVGRQKRGGEDPVVNLNNDSLVIFSFCLAVLEKDPMGSKVLDRYVQYQLKK